MTYFIGFSTFYNLALHTLACKILNVSKYQKEENLCNLYIFMRIFYFSEIFLQNMLFLDEAFQIPLKGLLILAS